MKKDQIFGFVRHILTYGAGYLTAKGLMSEGASQELVGLAMGLLGSAWSWTSKKEPSGNVTPLPLLLLLPFLCLGTGCSGLKFNNPLANLEGLAYDTSRVVAVGVLTKPNQSPAKIEEKRARISKILTRIEQIAVSTNTTSQDLWALLNPAISNLEWEQRMYVEGGMLLIRQTIGGSVAVETPQQVRDTAAGVARGLRDALDSTRPSATGPPPVPGLAGKVVSVPAWHPAEWQDNNSHAVHRSSTY